MKKVGIMTFHNSYNCGSMLESYAIQKVIERLDIGEVEIINFSTKNQKELYSPMYKNNSLKNVIKNIILLKAYKKIVFNNKKYEEFKNKYFNLTREYERMEELNDDGYFAVVAGSDQIWNITLEDGDDAYFLPWVKNAKKIAYAPSFGAKNIIKYSNNVEKYKNFLNNFNALSIRENNGKKWIYELIEKNVEVLLDPTLLLEEEDYEKISEKNEMINEKYIFFYCPSFNKKICEFVKDISKKYKLKVIAWSTKSYYVKGVKKYGFELPEYENPSMYLNLIKNAELIITTSYHGTIFSTIYRKKFITVKNGEMYGDDDRVITLLSQMNMMNRLISYNFDPTYNYLEEIDYKEYEERIEKLKDKSFDYLRKNLEMGKKDEK